ncbi:Ferrous iron transport protein B [Anaerohalosphaera lusitana]|uniref:Ferrous iron transport protein B n=1 Tax=Anaerohalosphaera lusitana TaxID=1936003 RepID=A0A1U9NPD2_9BACT|nr:ferrous iron transport protein B [Anaerohalosphaera lusitana]AQT69366.1 Ferrous iron transport protein B [Anaerohalosphaera lusitana]
MSNKKLKIAIAGNPNSGKTTVFNKITGSRQHVGNYPGVTVEKKIGLANHKGAELEIVDLPGTYSLDAYSIEERVARDFIFDEHPDVVVDIIDSSNVERNLYMAVQLMEMNVPLVLAFNMSDLARQKGLEFDLDQLSLFFGAPIVLTVGNKGKGIDDLLDAIVKKAGEPPKELAGRVHYGTEIEEELARIEPLVDTEHDLVQKYGSRYLAVKLLENDRQVMDKGHSSEVLEAVKHSRKHLIRIFDDEPEILIAERRYGFISGACHESVKRTIELRHDVSDMIDKLLAHRILGLPIFIGMMALVFHLTFTLGNYPMEWLQTLFSWAGNTITTHWPGSPDSQILSLIVDGIIGGVGGVVSFLPNILILFCAISILEDSGYMARAAFVMDQIMHKIGLHGKSFIPMLIGFGCSVPAIMSTRILENRRNRLTTIMVVPLMSCGARLPIYIMITTAFFTHHQGLVMTLIYLIGVALAIVAVKLLRKTIFRGETTPFVMELPPYRVPTIHGVLIHTWHRGWMYLRKAGTIILAISILLWAAAAYPQIDESELEGLNEQQAQTAQLQHSYVGKAGSAIETVIKPLGFDWKIGTALVGAFAAKEVFVSQMGIVYSLGGHTEASSEILTEKLRDNYTPLQGFCIMLFCLAAMPCVATVAMTRHETGSWGWALFQVAGLTILAYVLTLVVYQAGSFFGIGT